MGEAWSVYIVPKRSWDALRRAALALLDGWGDADARLGLAPFDAEHLVMQVEHHNGRYITLAGWENSGLVLHRSLGGRVTELHGDSSTDTVGVTAYDQGRVVDAHVTTRSAAPRLRRFRIDIGRALDFGGFGVSPSQLVEHWTLALHGPDPDAAHRLRFDVMSAQGTAEVPAAVAAVQRGADEGILDPSDASRLLEDLGSPDRAVDVLLRGPADTQAARIAIARRCMRLGHAERVAAWATDPAALDLQTRSTLLRALGRGAEARALLLEADAPHVDAYVRAAFREDPFAVVRPPEIDVTPVRTLVFRAALADADVRLLRPLDVEVMQELEASGVPALVALADRIRASARAVAEDPVPALRALLAVVHDPSKRRPYLGHLALALDAREDPAAGEALALAHREYLPDPELRRRVAEALDRRGGPPDVAPASGPAAGLPAPTPGATAAYAALEAQLTSNPDEPDDAARLALARFEAGYDDAGPRLEAAYIALSHGSRMRAPLEGALAALGLW